MEKNRKINVKKAGVFFGMFGVLFVVILLLSLNIMSPVFEKSVMEHRVNTLVPLGDPAAGESGFFYFMVYPHQAVPGTAYASNLSTGNAYEYATSGNVSCTGETPYGTTFDIVLKVGVNVTDGWNTTSSSWDDSFMWLTCTCADLSIGANTNMTELEIVNTSSYRWMHYYLNNGGAGYTITIGESFNVTSTKFWVKRLVT